MYFTILLLEVECIVNGTRVAVNRDRTPPSSDDTFQLSAQEMLIDAEGVIFSSSSLLLEPVRPERVLRARPGRSVAGSSSALVKLVAAVDIIAEIEASLKALSL